MYVVKTFLHIVQDAPRQGGERAFDPLLRQGGLFYPLLTVRYRTRIGVLRRTYHTSQAPFSHEEGTLSPKV